jgi:hypothetical protein
VFHGKTATVRRKVFHGKTAAIRLKLTLNWDFFTAHGRLNQLQEKPPEGVEQDDVCPPLPFRDESDDPQQNEDMSLHVLSSPQLGQQYVSTPSQENTNCSKTLPHWLHLYS